MSESYENAKADLDEFLNAFEVAEGQSGVAVLIDGEMKGFEIFLNSEIYREYHEKILKSYLINAEINDSVFTINTDTIESVITNALNGEFEEFKNEGEEKRFEFSDEDGLGSLYTFKDKLIHMSYFTGSIDLDSQSHKIHQNDVRI